MRFSRTISLIRQGIDRGLHPAAQLYVSRRGEVLIDEGFGQASPSTPMTRDSLTLWMSAGKPLAAVSV
ncbi:MAG: serine hydrolase, partial [Phycisphaerales bacterium]|nr:serine hydrolase [Phycisphaerales bacterium]